MSIRPARLASIAALVLWTSMFLGTAAQACQLVCLVLPDPGVDDAARNTACAAAKPGFKLAINGMASSLPTPSKDFYGAYRGISCDVFPFNAYMNGADPSFASATNISNIEFSCTGAAGTNPRIVCCNM